MRRLALSTILILGSFFVYGQSVKQLFPGIVKGIVRDSVHNHVLRSATAAVYLVKDRALLGYQITNTSGEFMLGNLPPETLLRIEISFIGYSGIYRDFIVPADKHQIDFKTLFLKPSEVNLKEVSIGVPPVTIKGDTLEFNADAFKLDTNAVVEDLLRKITNITVWADGVITVNGREVKRVLVNGKEFFGTDVRTSTQNIPKNAVDKIQVYNVSRNTSNPTDSLMELNIKLKKNKSRGHFGKLTAGYGTDNRYDGDANLNVFNSQLQVSIAAAVNNVNKSAKNTNTLIVNSSFRGVGASISYQPDFESSDLIKSQTIGASALYDFYASQPASGAKKASADYFAQKQTLDNNSAIQTINTIGDNKSTSQYSNVERNSSTTIQDQKAGYNFFNDRKSMIISESFTANTSREDYRNKISASDIAGRPLSASNTNQRNNSSGSKFSFSAHFNRRLDAAFSSHNNTRLLLTYSFNNIENNTSRHSISEFVSFVNPSSGRMYNRKYRSDRSSVNHSFSGEIKNVYLKSLGIHVSAANILQIKNTEDRNAVDDYGENAFVRNAYLSNNVNINVIEETPQITLSRSKVKSLSNRYLKSFSVDVQLQESILYQNISSDKDFQRFNRSYYRFTPNIIISRDVNQVGLYDQKMEIRYKTALAVPTLLQMAPLVDSIGFYSLRLGNLGLKEAMNRTLYMLFSHTKRGTKNPFDYRFAAEMGMVENGIADSTTIMSDNRRVTKPVNLNGSKSLMFEAATRKSYKLSKAEFQIMLAGRVQFTNYPGFLNGVLVSSDNTNWSADMSIYYLYKSRLAIESKLYYNYYLSKQRVFDIDYTGENMAVSISSNYIITKRFSVSSNATYRANKVEPAKMINYCIWNANASYRFFKGNNAEIKLSALDLLGQNKNVVNYGGPNSVSFGTQSALRRYFLFSLAYYPRKFGK